MLGLKNNNNASASDLISNHINDKTTITGDIDTDCDMRIDGNVKGNISSKAKVVIGKAAKIEGNIKCTDLTIEGSVVGDVSVDNSLHFRGTASFEGTIKYNSLVVENGAKIMGSLLQNRKNVSINNASKENNQQQQTA